MQETFNPTVMSDFKKANNIKDADFPYHNYESLLDQFVDDLAVYSLHPQGHPKQLHRKIFSHANAFNRNWKYLLCP